MCGSLGYCCDPVTTTVQDHYCERIGGKWYKPRSRRKKDEVIFFLFKMIPPLSPKTLEVPCGM